MWKGRSRTRLLEQEAEVELDVGVEAVEEVLAPGEDELRLLPHHLRLPPHQLHPRLRRALLCTPLCPPAFHLGGAGTGETGGVGFDQELELAGVGLEAGVLGVQGLQRRVHVPRRHQLVRLDLQPATNSSRISYEAVAFRTRRFWGRGGGGAWRFFRGTVVGLGGFSKREASKKGSLKVV